jgi:hypothetical protein
MQKGIEESGLIWTIDEHAGDIIPIKIYDKDGKLLINYSYKCMHIPIFGLDVEDVAMINDILDRLLKECEEKDAAEDAISRKEVNKLVDELARAISDERCCMSRGRSTATIMQDILDLQSVISKSKWIPISERLPEEDGRYLTYIVNNRLSYMMVCDYIQQTWCPDDQTASNNVTHWMPLPNEPYKDGKE